MSVVDASSKLKAIYCAHYLNNGTMFVFSYLVCKMGYQPYYVFVVQLLIGFLIFNPVYFILAKKIFDFPIKYFAQKALVPIFIVSIVSFSPFYFVNKLFLESNLRGYIIIAISMLWTGAVIMFIGLRKNERTKIIALVKRKILSR